MAKLTDIAISVKDAVKDLKTSRTTVINYIRDGKLSEDTSLGVRAILKDEKWKAIVKYHSEKIKRDSL